MLNFNSLVRNAFVRGCIYNPKYVYQRRFSTMFSKVLWIHIQYVLIANKGLKDREMKILFGSQTGNATYFAQELAKEAETHNWKTSIVDLKDYNQVLSQIYSNLLKVQRRDYRKSPSWSLWHLVLVKESLLIMQNHFTIGWWVKIPLHLLSIKQNTPYSVLAIQLTEENDIK